MALLLFFFIIYVKTQLLGSNLPAATSTKSCAGSWTACLPNQVPLFVDGESKTPMKFSYRCDPASDGSLFKPAIARSNDDSFTVGRTLIYEGDDVTAQCDGTLKTIDLPPNHCCGGVYPILDQTGYYFAGHAEDLEILFYTQNVGGGRGFADTEYQLFFFDPNAQCIVQVFSDDIVAEPDFFDYHFSFVPDADPGAECWNYMGNDPLACSGNGNCIADNECACYLGYSGYQCRIYECYGKDSIASDVCNGFGKCTKPNTCSCGPGFSGDECDTCDRSKCSFGGDCTVDAPNTFSCSCDAGPVTLSGSICENCDVDGNVGTYWDGYCYYAFLDTTNMDWQMSRDYCKANFHIASDLPIVDTPEIQIAVDSEKGENHLGWILLSDGATPGTWEWKDGTTTFSYENWNNGVDSQVETEHCAYMHHSGVWKSFLCHSKLAMDSVVCGLDISDYGNPYSSVVNINIGWKTYDFLNGWCDWTSNPTCPVSYQLCNSVQQGQQGVCSDKGTCQFNTIDRINECNCIGGWEGENCDVEDVPINGIDCTVINGHCYHMFTDKKSWIDSRTACKAWHPAADLAIIMNKDVQKIVHGIVGTEIAWIGALDFVEGTWEWVDHVSRTYTNWRDYNDDAKKGEDCADIRGGAPYNGAWSTTWCNLARSYVCGLDLNDAEASFSSNAWVNVVYENLNTDSATCDCDITGGVPCPCPTGGCNESC